jgi:hypothetical protein
VKVQMQALLVAGAGEDACTADSINAQSFVK